MFSSFKKAGEVQIRRTPALEPGAVVYLNTSSEIIGERFFHETEFRFVVVPRLLMRKICAETPPPPHTHTHHPPNPTQSTRVIPKYETSCQRSQGKQVGSAFQRIGPLESNRSNWIHNVGINKAFGCVVSPSDKLHFWIRFRRTGSDSSV